ncbi:MAG: MFS transporter [candidate division Zixibacteria bacterium]|nr:MFS transporter [candidate division Zixibacteria bacterium]
MSLEQIQARKYRFFTVGAIGTFMATLDGSILNVALPSIARDFGATIDMVAWVVLAYALTLISLMLPFGAWIENRGYGFAYKFGYVFFLAGSILCAFSDTIYMLIGARVLQAVGSAMFSAVGPGMVTTVFPERERGKGLGMMVMMVSAGFMVGPPLGGYILGIWSWHGIFLVNVPIGLFGLYMAHRYFRLLQPPKAHRRIPLAAAVSISLALVTGVFALSLIDNYPLSDPRIWGLALVSLAFGGLFLRQEGRPESALIGLAIFRNRQFTSATVAQLAHFVSLSGVLILIPFYLEQVKGLPPSRVGLFLLILPVLMLILAPTAGRLSDKIGFRALTSAGMIVLAAGLWMLSQVTPQSDLSHVVYSLIVVGVGVGLFSTPNSSAFMGSVSAKQRAVASGILATNRNIGMSVGIALATTLFAFFQQRYAGLGDENLIFTSSYRSVIFVSMAYAGIGLLFCLMRENRTKEAAEA